MLILNNRKFLIYGFGRSGKSCFKFLEKKNQINIYDDLKINLPLKFKKFFISKKIIKKKNFDHIVISPGIDIKNCSLKYYLKKNQSKIITDLDILYFAYKENTKIAITGTNGKSTTAKLIKDILKKNKIDVRLVGNIGNAALNEKKISKKTIFVVEISSYQIEYSKYFKGDISAILNISPDHLERHLTFKNYLKTKVKLIENQPSGTLSFIKRNDKQIINYLKKRDIKSTIKKIDINFGKNFLNKITNSYFKNVNNLSNLKFATEILKLFNIKEKTILKVLNKFRNLPYRQQIIYNKNKLLIINDSKSTSFSSTNSLLKYYKNIYWILGGIAKKGDVLTLNKKYIKNLKVYIYGHDKIFFEKCLKKSFYLKKFKNLQCAITEVINDASKDKIDKSILFSPAAASFDQFANFEERGQKFNFLLKKLNFIKKVINAK